MSARSGVIVVSLVVLEVPTRPTTGLSARAAAGNVAAFTVTAPLADSVDVWLTRPDRHSLAVALRRTGRDLHVRVRETVPPLR